MGKCIPQMLRVILCSSKRIDTFYPPADLNWGRKIYVILRENVAIEFSFRSPLILIETLTETEANQILKLTRAGPHLIDFNLTTQSATNYTICPSKFS